MAFNAKDVFGLVGDWIGGLVDLFTSFVALGVLAELIFGSPIFGVSVVSNLIGLVSNFGSNGFAGLLALLILIGLYKK